VKRLVLTSAIFIFSLWASVQAGDSKILVDTNQKPGGQLRLMHFVGMVSITGTQSDRVKITETLSSYTDRGKRREGEFSSVQFDGNKIIISGNSNTFAYHQLSAEVPTFFSVAVDGAGGNITVDNITGEILIHVAGGDTELNNIKGLVTVNTSAGDVYMQDFQGRATVTTLGGNLDLKGFVGNVSLKNNAGDITITDGIGNVQIQSGSGDLMIGQLKGDSLLANMQAGDLSLTGFTGNGTFILNYGDVNIDEMVGPLDVSLDMGSMAIQHLRGKLDARLKMGNLEVVRHEGSGVVNLEQGDVDYDWAVEKTKQGDSLSIRTSVGSVYLGYNHEANPSLILKAHGDIDGIEKLSGVFKTDEKNRQRRIYIYSGSKEKASITTEIGRIKIYER